MAIGLTALLWLDLTQRIDKLATSRSDNTQWTISQLEVDYFRLVLAAETASQDDLGAVAGLRTRFDIFYSRWRTLGRAEAYALLPEDARYKAAQAEVNRVLDAAVPLIDGPEAELVAGLPDLQAQFEAIREPVRTIALRGLDIFAEQSDQQRREIVALILRTGLVTLVLLVVLTIAAILMIAAGRRAREDAQRIEEVNRNLSMIVETSLDAIIVADAQGIVRAYNPAAEAIFGWTQAEIIGRPMAEMMIPVHHRAAHAAGMKRFLTTGERRIIGAGRVQMEACHKSGRLFPVEVSITHERVGGRHVFVSFLRDITHRLQAEADLRAARDEALAAARKKSEFLAIMSHEIRTPLNGILGAVDLLQATPLDEAQARHVRTLRRSGDILLGHVNDVLDLTRLETGTETLRPRPMDLRAVFDRVLENQDGAARKAGNRMSALVAPDVPPSLLADDRRLSQVLLNLVGNANKFTSGGEIVLSACCLGVADGQARLVLSVADTGVGIPTGDRARIFEDFVMLDPSYDRNAQGTGLGLGIARRIVQAMGGTIDVRDSAGGGADFHIELTLPVADAPAAAPAVPDRDRAAVGPMSVLMVEDNPINREVLRAMLEQEGHRVTEAADGTAGVAAAATARFDLILMDISMPGMNGTEAARAIREGGGPNAATPIVATTAHALPAEIASFRANGMPQTLTKPISRAALRALLAGYGADEDLSPPGTAPGAGTGTADLLDPAKLAEFSETLGDTRFRDMIAQFAQDAAAFETRLAAGQDGASALAATAHNLAGSAGMIGLPALQRLLAAFETAVKTTGALPPEALRADLLRTSAETRAELGDLVDAD